MSEAYHIDFDRYYDYEELAGIMKGLSDAYPGLATLRSVGQSCQGREVWLLEITDKASGAGPDSKPGYYIDAVTHAEEISGAIVALYTAWYLLTRYGQDEMVTRLLDWQTFYIVPVVNPDGLEVVLKDAFHEWIGNGRFLPGEDQVGPGLHYADVNDDGVIVDMRIRDDKGEWKVSDRDPRILVHRQPYEYGGQYYRLLPEGYIAGYDGAEIPIPRPRDGNLNRNYPYRWGPENEQYGAGAYPLSEPEISAVTQFILTHPNIVGALNYHTNAGAVLLPFEGGEKGMPYEDQVVFKAIGEIGVEATGYGLIGDEKEFNLPNVPPRMGTSGGFLYVQLGVAGVVTELWDVYQKAGIEKDWFFPIRPFSEEESLKLLKWSDEQLDGEGFVDWMPFDHPQLGEVELGGWRRLFMFRNPPPHCLEEMAHKNALFTLRHALTAPRLRIADLAITPLGNDLFRLEAVVENLGYLPTNGTQQALNVGAVKPVTVELVMDDGVELVAGRRVVELGHLAGRSERGMQYSRFIDWHASARKAEWVLRAVDAAGARIEVLAVGQRAGLDTRKVSLNAVA
jgi:murein tripeptide amidase MpaA